MVGLTERTVQRWVAQGGGDDLRRGPKSTPRNKLTAAEEQQVLAVANSPEFHDVSPRQIVPTLADRGTYHASESAFYRILRKLGLLHHRAHSRPPTSRPRALTATGPDQVYSWDITYLRSRVRGVYYYLYLVVDIWSRRIVGWAIHDIELGELAAELVERICAAHADTLKEATPSLIKAVQFRDVYVDTPGGVRAVLERCNIVPAFGL